MNNTETRLAVNEAASLIRSHRDIYLATHIRPDGDALGSLLALALALEAAGHRVARLCTYPAPSDYRFLAGAELISATPPEWPGQLGVVVDSDGLNRIGDLEPVFAALPRLIDIDHHATEKSFGDVRMVDSSVAATAELVYELLLALGAEITPQIATGLYTAILTDTGRFAFSNTSARALALAATLVRAGADPASVASMVYFRRSSAAVRLMGVALSRLTRHLDGRVISSALQLRDFAETGAVHMDTEGIIDQIRAVGGPQVAMLFVETEGGETRVSLRSDGEPDVSKIALRFDGGGHRAAAGCTIKGRPEEARELVLTAARELFGLSG
jgi:phosphoesterase RecJ-like protein